MFSSARMRFPFGSLLLSFCLSGFFIMGCRESNQRLPTGELADEVRNREIRHITPGQITQAAMKRGETVARGVQTALVRKLTTAIPAEGLVEAGRYCQQANLPGADSLGKAYKADIRRYRLRGALDKKDLSDKVFQVLDAYRYSAEQNQSIDPGVQGDGQFMLYSAPVVLNQAVCLKCHGQVGSDVSEADYQALSGRYRLDSLVNYRAGQSVAVWLLRFERKEVVKSIPE
jgi:hypothetical protein